MSYLFGIKGGLQKGHLPELISRKIFLSYPTFFFEDCPELQFEIFLEVQNFFKIPFTSIQVCGSSKTGISFFKSKLFTTGESDLDLAIINEYLYNKLSQECHAITDGYTDNTKFGVYNGGKSTQGVFHHNLKNGSINPFFMPECASKQEFERFFNSLSNRYSNNFKSITACFYQSEYYFERKQVDSINKYKYNQGFYDKLSGKI